MLFGSLEAWKRWISGIINLKRLILQGIRKKIYIIDTNTAKVLLMSETLHTTNTNTNTNKFYLKWHNTSVFHIKECINSPNSGGWAPWIPDSLSLAPSIFCTHSTAVMSVIEISTPRHGTTWENVGKNSFHWKKMSFTNKTVHKLSGNWKTDSFTLGTEHVSCLFFFFFSPLPIFPFLFHLFYPHLFFLLV